MSSAKKGQAAEVLETLLRKLNDEALQQYLPDHSPDQARKLLRYAIDQVVPAEQQKKTVPSQTSLWEKGTGSWQGKLAGRTLQLYSDGASRGNPGEAGGGVVILDDDGFELAGHSKYFGKCTNNEAEYRALLFGLEKCMEFGSGNLEVFLDSELIVKQISGEYRVKHPSLKPLHEKATGKLASFASYRVRHVPREQNSRADSLANQAIDNK